MIDPSSLPDHFISKIAPEDRAQIDASIMTRAEKLAISQRGEELREQKLFQSWLNLHGIPYAHASTHKPSTIAVGFPDFALFYRDRFLLIEFKSALGELSKEQNDYFRLCRSKGVFVHVCRSAHEAIDLARRDLFL